MQVRCAVQLAARFAAAAVGAIILLLGPFMMTLAVDVLTHSIHIHATTLVLKYVAHHNHCRGWFEYDADRSREWGATMCAAAASQ